MIKPFDSLYTDLEKVLKRVEKERGPEKYQHGMEVIREKIERMRALGRKFLRSSPKEITYFRDVWPVFHARLFLYIRLYDLELRREAVPVDSWAAVLGEEERQVGTFFRQNGVFWRYYRSGAPALNEQFTRVYSRGRILDPLAVVIDQEGATLASYRAACCLSMNALGEWLQEQREKLSGEMTLGERREYSWGASDADLAEWLFGIQAVGGIRYKGQPADVSRLQKWARMAVGREVANIYDRGRVLRTRKKERLAFTKKIAAALGKKWDQAEGKFE
jgi:hypothetical protein